MMSSQIDDRRSRGRPRGFDQTEALEAAMRVFWRSGYDGASIEALTREMGVRRSSLYHLFSDKESLFLLVVEHYSQTRLTPLLSALDSGDCLRDDLGAFFEAVVSHATDDPGRLGCLVACVLVDAAGADDRMRAELARRFAVVEARIASRLERAAVNGKLAGHEPEAVASVIGAVARGMMLSARAGVPPERLRQTGRMAQTLIAGD